jgi:hypothetical protein
MSKKAHLAVHISNSSGTPVTRIVIQPRNSLGQFLSPSIRYARSIFTNHITMNGEVVRRGRLTR